MVFDSCLIKQSWVITAVACAFFTMFPIYCDAKQLSDAEIARAIVQENNRVIIEGFLKYELQEVNEYVAKPLLKSHPSLIFFIKQAERGPLKNLLFLEDQVHKLQAAQKNINSFPYSILFSSSEKKKILGLRPAADKIISYGIPLMKRDFYRVIVAAKELADKKKKHPMELIPDWRFRDAIYRQVEPTPEGLDREMGKLSEGELVCISLGWVLEQVNLTRLWMTFNDNRLPDKNDYMVFRKKRSEYFQKRLKRIYRESASGKVDPKRKTVR